MVYLELIFNILLIIMIPLIIIGSISLLFDEKKLGFVLLLIAVCIFFILYTMEKEVIKEQEEYKKTTVTKTHSAVVSKLEFERTKNNISNKTHTYDVMIMILEDGTIEKIDSKLYASLSEGMEVYWDVCVKNCDYFSDERTYFIKNE